MGQHIKAYPTTSEVDLLELDAPRVAYIEDIGTAIFSSGLSHVEDLHEDYYKSLLEELMERIAALEEGKKGSGVFLSTTEYEKLTDPNGNHTAIDEDGKIITYDPQATYYTYDEEEGTVDVINPEVDDNEFLILDKGIVDSEDFLDLSKYAYVDDDDFLAFYTAPISGDKPYVDGDGNIVAGVVDDDDFLGFENFGYVDEEGYFVLDTVIDLSENNPDIQILSNAVVDNEDFLELNTIVENDYLTIE